ncbi:MAG: hypothetical protein WCX64_06320, partial [Candidatus Micrarchaeia archaeon]
MSLEKINALLSPGLSEAERLSNVKSLLERHGVLLDRIRNNTGRPKGKRPGMWPCQCYSDVKLLMGPENLEQIYDNVAQSESCHDRRSKLTMYTANNQFHSIPPQVKGAFIAQF